MKKILVPTDGSKNADKALLQAKRIAKAFGESKIVILTVVQDVVITPYMTEQYYTTKTNEGLVEAGQALLDESVKMFDDFDGEVEAKLKVGPSANVIINEIEDEEYDLVVMGSRGLGAFSRAMLGSVSNKVLNHIQTDIIIVK